LRDQAIQRTLEILGRCFERQTSRVDNHIPSVIDFGETQPQSLPQTPLHSIPAHGAPEGPRNGEPQPGSFALGALDRETKRRKAGTGDSSAFGIDFAEIGRFQDTRAFRKP
jgi:hypothetical protein